MVDISKFRQYAEEAYSRRSAETRELLSPLGQCISSRLIKWNIASFEVYLDKYSYRLYGRLFRDLDVNSEEYYRVLKEFVEGSARSNPTVNVATCLMKIFSLATFPLAAIV